GVQLMRSRHMRTATRRRVGAVATVAMAIGGLSAAAAGPAHAEVLYPASYATLGVQFDNSASCTTSGTGDSVQTIGPFTADGEPHTATHGSSLTVTRTGNPADVTTATASVT